MLESVCNGTDNILLLHFYHRIFIGLLLGTARIILPFGAAGQAIYRVAASSLLHTLSAAPMQKTFETRLYLRGKRGNLVINIPTPRVQHPHAFISMLRPASHPALVIRATTDNYQSIEQLEIHQKLAVGLGFNIILCECEEGHQTRVTQVLHETRDINTTP